MSTDRPAPAPTQFPSDACPGPGGASGFTNRRAFLRRAGGGFGMLALASLLDRAGLLAGTAAAAGNPLAPKPAHRPAKAQRVIFLFMSGGPSHVDLFDPKPELIRLAGPALSLL